MMNLSEILDDVILKGFQELLPDDIEINFLKQDDCLLSYGSYKDHGYFIEVDLKFNDASVDVLRGGIAHELAHISHEKLNKLGFVDSFLYKHSERFRILDERNTDLEVIFRGFGADLLQFLDYREMLGYSMDDYEGLTRREVKSLMTKVAV